jgi:hypothetical protein
MPLAPFYQRDKKQARRNMEPLSKPLPVHEERLRN